MTLGKWKWWTHRGQRPNNLSTNTTKGDFELFIILSVLRKNDEPTEVDEPTDKFSYAYNFFENKPE